MSTRSQWSFRENGKQIALIYKHSDGYPDGEHGGFAVWQRFVDKVIKDCAAGFGGNRFDDAEYLAARFVYFLLRWENGYENLNTLGVGVSKDLHGDIEYLYEIDCDGKAPVLRCKQIRTGNYVNSLGNIVKVKAKREKLPTISAEEIINNPPWSTNWKPSNGYKPKGSVTIAGKTYESLNDLPSVPLKKRFANDSHLKLRRDSAGHFIPMDDIAEFDYPHNGEHQFRIVKVVEEDEKSIAGVQANGNTGFKRFNKNKIGGLYRYKGYID